jgi:hypothetical protein
MLAVSKEIRLKGEMEMSDNFRYLLNYSLTEYYNCDDEQYTKVLNIITDKLIDVAHENGWEQEVSQVLDSFN